jgi:hypothetical protein
LSHTHTLFDTHKFVTRTRTHTQLANITLTHTSLTHTAPSHTALSHPHHSLTQLFQTHTHMCHTTISHTTLSHSSFTQSVFPPSPLSLLPFAFHFHTCVVRSMQHVFKFRDYYASLLCTLSTQQHAPLRQGTFPQQGLSWAMFWSHGIT